MNDSLRSLSTNDSLEGQSKKKKKPSKAKQQRSQKLSYNEMVYLLNPNHLFINISLEDKFNQIEIVDPPYFPDFRFTMDESLDIQEVQWRRLPSLIRLAD